MPIASKLTETWSPWVPLTIVVLIGPLNALLMVFTPETLDQAKATLSSEVLLPESETVEAEGWWPMMKSRLGRQVNQARGSLALINNREVALIMLVYLCLSPVITAVAGIFLQYFSKRFGWTLAETGYLLAMRGGLVMFVMGLLLPGLSKLLTSGGFHIRLTAYRKDLFLARASAIVLLLGILFIAGPSVASVILGLVVITFSAGLGPLCRSLVANYVEQTQISRMFTFISIVETIGGLPAGPILAWALSTGMKLQGFFYPLPFYLVAICSLVIIFALFSLGNGKGRMECEPTPSSDHNPDAFSAHTLGDDPI
jgi:MFS transporter, PCFT/HCP family, solute carrier family 46 (folate transporter), member 1